MTVAELRSRITHRELLQWAEYLSLEPFGPIRDNLHAGAICSVIQNLVRGKNDKAAHPVDFLLTNRAESETKKAPESTEAMMAKAKLVHMMMGGRIRGRNQPETGRAQGTGQAPPVDR